MNMISVLVWLAIRFKIMTRYTWVFLSRILVKISYIWAFIPRIRPFSTHVRVQNLRIYAAFKGPHMRGLKCAYTRLRNRIRWFRKSSVYAGMKSAFLWKGRKVPVKTQAAQAHASRKRGIYKLFMVLESGRHLRERPVLGYKRPLTI